jgi:hypothetical protein
MAILPLSAQSNQDSITISRGKESAMRQYQLATEGTHHLYNGSEYIAYEPLNDEHPYFLTEEWILASIKYDGEWFHNIPLLYDIHREKLVTSYYYKGNKMELNNYMIEEFVIDNRRFLNFKESTDSTTKRKGFYESLYDGKSSVIARREKKFSQTIDVTEVSRKFIESSSFFILTKGKFNKISSQSDLLKALTSYKKELKIFIRKNHLFQKNFESSVVQAARYFDTLNP